MRSKSDAGSRLGAAAPRVGLSLTGLVSRVGVVVSGACLVCKLLQGYSNGSKGGRDRDPGGGPESRLWAAVVERGQEARTARPDD
jgi:hypothetical protein